MTAATFDLSAALDHLAQVTEEYAARTADLDAARRAENEALNRLNEAQAEVDEQFAKLRRDAPVASDWRTIIYAAKDDTSGTSGAK